MLTIQSNRPSALKRTGLYGLVVCVALVGFGPIACAPAEDLGDPVDRDQLYGDASDTDTPTDDVTDEVEDEDNGEDDGEEENTSDEDDAQLVSIDLPSDLSCGETYAASVEMRNSGTSTWTREGGFKLGAVDDEDSLYGPDVRVWLPEDASVAPGESYTFEFDLTAPQLSDDYLTDWRMVHEEVRWFGDTTSETVAVDCDQQTVCDPLTSSSLQSGFATKQIDGGQFSSSGWQTTGNGDQILLELSSELSGSGLFEIDVTNFDPTSQYASTKHQIISMYTSDNGSQDVFESDEAWWNIRTGTNYYTGLKILAAPNGGDSREEARLIESATWDPSDVHTFTVEWDSDDLHIYLNGDLLETLPFDGRAQPLQHIFIGKDNVYVGQVGPIYSNLCVTENP